MNYKSLILLAAVSVGSSLSAAEITVVSTEKLEVEDAFHPTLSPKGNVVLFTGETHQGLRSLNFESNEVAVLDEGVGAGFNPVFSADGGEVVFRTVVSQDGLVRRDVKRYSLTTGEAVQIAAPSRGAVNTMAIIGGNYAYGFSDRQAIEVCVAGKAMMINPIENGYRYMWPAISPSNEKLLFNETYTGLYVSNIDGSKAKHLSMRADFPCWAGDNYIVAVYSEDDGYVVTKANVIAINIETGEIKTLTNDDVIVSGVTATSDKIVYTTEDGQMYIMNIKITE